MRVRHRGSSPQVPFTPQNLFSAIWEEQRMSARRGDALSNLMSYLPQPTHSQPMLAHPMQQQSAILAPASSMMSQQFVAPSYSQLQPGQGALLPATSAHLMHTQSQPAMLSVSISDLMAMGQMGMGQLNHVAARSRHNSGSRNHSRGQFD